MGISKLNKISIVSAYIKNTTSFTEQELPLSFNMKTIMVFSICFMFVLGFILNGASAQHCRDQEHWCGFVKHNLGQCTKWPCIANICKKTCGKCDPIDECWKTCPCDCVNGVCISQKWGDQEVCP